MASREEFLRTAGVWGLAEWIGRAWLHRYQCNLKRGVISTSE